MTNAMSKPIISDKHIDANNLIENIIPKYLKGELALKSCKLPDLKAFARNYKLRITGTKPELIERIEMHFKKNKSASVIQAVFRGHLVRFSIRLRGCALKERTKCVNDSDFYTMDPLNEIEYNDFYSYVDKQSFIYGFSVSSLIALFKRKGHITNPYNREKLDFKTMNEIFLLYKLNQILYPEPVVIKPNATTAPTMTNQVVRVASLPVPATPAQPAASTTPVPPPLPVAQNNDPRITELRERMNVIQSRSTDDRIRELFMEMDQLGNYTNTSWFSNLTDRGLVNLFRYLYDIWTYRGQLTQQTKNRICSLQNPFLGMTNLQTLEVDELRKHCLHVMEHMVYTGIDIEFQRIGTLHVLSAMTLVSLPARQAMYWLYEGLVY
jgi:hypothetical protein